MISLATTRQIDMGRVVSTVISNYYKINWSNILPDTTSLVKTDAILVEYA